MSLTNLVAVQLQTVRKKLQDLLEMSTTAASLIKAGTEVQQVSKKEYRMPFVYANGGDFGTVNIDGGPMGLGSGMRFAELQQSYFVQKVGVQMTLEEMWTTETSSQAVVNVFKETMKRSLEEFQVYDDISFHNSPGSGNLGIIGTLASSGGAGSVTSNTQALVFTAPMGAQLLRNFQPVEIFSSNMGAQRTAAGSPDNLPRVTEIDPLGKTALLTNVAPTTNITSGGAQDGDNIVFAGMTPSGTWKNGLYYFNTTTNSGAFLNISDRTVYPELNSNFIAGGGGQLAPAQVLLLKHKILQRRGVVNDLVALAHPAQQYQLAQLGLAWSTWMRGQNDKMIDLMPNVGTSVTLGGIELKADIRQARDRIDFLATKTWGRARLKDLDYLELDGQRVFEVRSSNGGVSAAVVWYLIQAENFYCVDPGQNGCITGLAIPAGY